MSIHDFTAFEGNQGEFVLMCPKCGGCVVSSGRVELPGKRLASGGKQMITVDGGNVNMREVPVFEPYPPQKEYVLGYRRPPREQLLLRIGFMCEACSDVGCLSVSEYKGQTLFRWEDVAYEESAEDYEL